jgi:hypothetical protein
MAIQPPMTAAEYQKKYGQPVNFNMPEDQSVKAAHGFQTSVFAPAEPSFEAATKQAKKGNMFTRMLGLTEATDVFGAHIARSRVGSALIGGDLEASREFIPKPTAGQTAGALAQTAATALAPAIAPVGLPAQMAAGAALGYAYDVGSDMVAQKSIGETLTPGVGTAAGVLAPPIIRGAIGAGSAALGGRVAAQQGDAVIPAIREGAEAVTQSAPIQAAQQTLSEAGTRVGRILQRPAQAVRSKAEQAARIQQLPKNARPAVRVGIDDAIVDLAVQGDAPTRDAMRKMVQMAEQPKSARPTAGPASVASDVAVDQYQVIERQRRVIGDQIGALSDELPTLQNIDITPTRQAVTDVLGNNGIQLTPEGQLVATDNMRVSDEQLSVLNKIWQRVSSRNDMSAKNLHELDQWFSSTQRTARVVDKIEDMYIKVPTPENEMIDVPIYKFFRDAFGQRLDDVAPANLRDLNRQYRQLSNLTEDVESTLVRNSNLQTLQQSDISNPSGLRRLFGEAQSAEDFRMIYNQMDELSRNLGYQGARADELYYFANKIRDYYPDTIPDTGFRGGIGSSIRDVIGSTLRIGEVTPADQQQALKRLLEMTD